MFPVHPIQSTTLQLAQTCTNASLFGASGLSFQGINPKPGWDDASEFARMGKKVFNARGVHYQRSAGRCLWRPATRVHLQRNLLDQVGPVTMTIATNGQLSNDALIRRHTGSLVESGCAVDPTGQAQIAYSDDGLTRATAGAGDVPV